AVGRVGHRIRHIRVAAGDPQTVRSGGLGAAQSGEEKNAQATQQVRNFHTTRISQRPCQQAFSPFNGLFVVSPSRLLTSKLSPAAYLPQSRGIRCPKICLSVPEDDNQRERGR